MLLLLTLRLLLQIDAVTKAKLDDDKGEEDVSGGDDDRKNNFSPTFADLSFMPLSYDD